MGAHPAGAGKSSIGLVDAGKVLDLLGLEPHWRVLDLGCGRGDWSLALAGRLGPEGLVYALDAWPEGLEALKETLAQRGESRVRPLAADAGRNIPLPDSSLDLAFLGVVLHDLAEDGKAEAALRELGRALRPGGRLAFLEFNKVEGPPGPPRSIRISPQELEYMLAPLGHRRIILEKAGEYNYLALYESAV